MLLSDLASVVPLCAENIRANAAAVAPATTVAAIALRWDDAAPLVEHGLRPAGVRRPVRPLGGSHTPPAAPTHPGAS